MIGRFREMEIILGWWSIWRVFLTAKASAEGTSKVYYDKAETKQVSSMLYNSTVQGR